MRWDGRRWSRGGRFAGASWAGVAAVVEERFVGGQEVGQAVVLRWESHVEG